MEFSRMGEHTIRCMVTEAEIQDMGYTMEEIMRNGNRTQEFMSRIFEMAERQFSMKFESGVKTVRADFLPNHILCLTFSSHPAEGILEHLKDIVGNLLGENPMPEDADEEEDEQETKPKPAPKRRTPAHLENEISVIIIFADFDVAARFAKQTGTQQMPYNALYKHQGRYYLVMDLSTCTEEEVLKLSVLTDEYAAEIRAGQQYRAFVEEHARVILKDHAIENLKLL